MTGKRSTHQTEECSAIAAAVDVLDASGAVKTDFLVMPFGNPIRARDGRKWILRDAAHAERVIATTQATLASVEMMIDYDHQAAYAADGVGNRAPAAGWANRIYAAQDGIHLVVDWTAPALAALTAREYRYISPDFRFDKLTGEVTRIVRAGLTNSPAIDLPALAHAGASTGEDHDMKMISIAALAAALALSGDPDEAAVLAAIKQLRDDKTGSDAALASLRTELGLDADAGTEAVLASVKSVKAAGEPDPAAYVPKAGYDELAGRLAKIEEQRVLASVDQAVADGKIAPAMKDWAINLGKKDEQALASFIAQSVPFGGAAQIKGEPKAEKGKLNDEEKAICAMTGVSEADFLKTRDGANEEAA